MPRKRRGDGESGSSSKEILYCSFCSKSQYEVKRLIAGPSTYICNECIDSCGKILEEDTQTSEVSNVSDKPLNSLPKPMEIKAC